MVRSGKAFSPPCDGVTSYTDILWSVDSKEKVPAIVDWSPYGKTIPASKIPIGVSASEVTGLMKEEGPDAGF